MSLGHETLQLFSTKCLLNGLKAKLATVLLKV